ncbi:MAG: hypothetical protein IBJ10_02315 [Phycisphaerales bacterium]|nr:hypothetical protein [Phycisphaerales bacterium]
MKKTLSACVFVAASLSLTCCGGGTVDYAREFPRDTARAPSLGIQVVRDTTEIRLTNTTSRAFGPSTLWLNRWYSRPIDGLGVGETLTLQLASFRDESSEAFRGGGFWATKQPQRIVSADLESEGELLGLVVIADRR